jgi:hypothetical protein
MWAVQGILAALYERQRTGTGRLVECSLLGTAIGFSSWTSAQWLADHEEPIRQGSRHRQNAPYQRMNGGADQGAPRQGCALNIVTRNFALETCFGRRVDRALLGFG